MIGTTDAKDATGTKGTSTSSSLPPEAGASTPPSSDKTASPSGPAPDLPTYYSNVIYGSPRPQPPDASLTLEQRKQRIDAFVERFKSIVEQTKGTYVGEAQANANFICNQSFMTPKGYISAGLLAGGFDPHEKIKVTYTDTTQFPGQVEHVSGSYDRTYEAWEIAAGMHKHDQPDNFGHIVNFKYEDIKSEEAKQKIHDLESIGETLQTSWENDIRAPMSDPGGALAQRAGKADAFMVKTMLESLRQDKVAFGKLSPEAQQTVNRTLDANGPVIIPNLYGYPMEKYAFIPEETNDNGRPNHGLMLDIRNVTANEIKGDDAAADWLQKNQGIVLGRFNAKDAQGGTDAHWLKPSIVLDNFIHNPSVRLEGPVFHGSFPVREAFNYTGSATSGYALKSAPLDKIAAEYATLNANNTSALDQTQVFGPDQQGWKKAENIWNGTFGYVPLIGNAGNIVFGIHDANTGMTAEERRGGFATASISSLQLANEIAVREVVGTGPSPFTLKVSSAPKWEWKVDPETNEFRLTPRPMEVGNSKAPVEVAEGHVAGKPGAVNELNIPKRVLELKADVDPRQLELDKGRGLYRHRVDHDDYVRIGENDYYRVKKEGNGYVIVNPRNPHTVTGGVPIKLDGKGGVEQFLEGSPGLKGGADDPPASLPGMETHETDPIDMIVQAMNQYEQEQLWEENIAPLPEEQRNMDTDAPDSPAQSISSDSSSTGSSDSSRSWDAQGIERKSPPADDPNPPANEYKDEVALPPGGYFNRLGLIERTDIPKLYRVEKKTRVNRRGSPAQVGFRNSVWFAGPDKMIDGPTLITSRSKQAAINFGEGEFGHGNYSLYQIDARGLKAASLRENVDINSKFTSEREHYPSDYIETMQAQGSSLDTFAENAYKYDEVHVDNSQLTSKRIQEIPPYSY
ncbi:hypothetical protein [Dyella nitratireducens]|uniref:hypothetical protein n=1 Tax=Dyella nitratireducens TaxID=1849580 RepID=UPI0016692404|nr:hypothetical protein [Dyella nitratireducens]